MGMATCRLRQTHEPNLIGQLQEMVYDLLPSARSTYAKATGEDPRLTNAHGKFLLPEGDPGHSGTTPKNERN